MYYNLYIKSISKVKFTYKIKILKTKYLFYFKIYIRILSSWCWVIDASKEESEDRNSIKEERKATKKDFIILCYCIIKIKKEYLYMSKPF